MHRHQHRTLAVTFVTIGATLALCGPAPLAVHERTQAPSAAKVFSIDKSYGTLEFRGLVERTETQDEYEFRARLAATFRPSAPFNRVPVARLTIMQLSATRMLPGGARADLLHRDVQAIDVTLADDGETQSLPEVTFRLPKAAAGKASHVGLAVSDGKIVWPISAELR